MFVQRDPLKLPMSVNLALGKSASQSSDYITHHKHCKPEHKGARPASNAVDGDTADDGPYDRNTEGNNGHFVNHTNADPRSWWQVDLGSSDFELDRIVVTTRTSCMSRLFPSYVMVSRTPFAQTGADIASLEAARKQAIFEYRLTTQQRATTITLPASTFGRYVRVQLGTRNCLHLCQVEVFACNMQSRRQWARVFAQCISGTPAIMQISPLLTFFSEYPGLIRFIGAILLRFYSPVTNSDDLGASITWKLAATLAETRQQLRDTQAMLKRHQEEVAARFEILEKIVLAGSPGG